MRQTVPVIQGYSSTALAAGLVLLSSLCALGQVSVVRSGSFEAGGFAGATYGIDQFRAMGGGNVTYAANRWLLPYFEYSFFPGIERDASVAIAGLPAAATARFSLPFSDVHGGVHIRIPIRESPIVPYGVFGVGILHNPSTSETFTYFDGTSSQTVSTKVISDTSPAINFGGGIRYYIDQRFGIRMEAKAYRLIDGGTLNAGFGSSRVTSSAIFGKVECGFFFQFR